MKDGCQTKPTISVAVSVVALSVKTSRGGIWLWAMAPKPILIDELLRLSAL